MTAIWETCLYQGGTLTVFLAMADCASGHDGSGIFPGNDYLAAKCRQSVRATLDCIKRLRADGAVKQVGENGDDLPPDENYPGGRGHKAEYRIDLERVQELQALHEAAKSDCEICKQHRLASQRKRRRDSKKGEVHARKGELFDLKGEVSRARIEEEPSEPSLNLPPELKCNGDALVLEARVANPERQGVQSGTDVRTSRLNNETNLRRLVIRKDAARKELRANPDLEPPTDFPELKLAAADRERLTRAGLTDTTLANWFDQCKFEVANGELHVTVAKPYVRNWISTHFVAQLERAWKAEFGDLRVIVHVATTRDQAA